MNTDRELMQQALEALEFHVKNADEIEEIDLVLVTALRDRLAQPEQDYRIRYDRGCYKCGSHYCPADCPEPTHLVAQQPQMQPCAGRNCGSTNPNLHSAECFEDYEKATGMRAWQGLTDEERNSLWRDVVGWGDPSHDDEDLMKAIEAKLREKNA